MRIFLFPRFRSGPGSPTVHSTYNVASNSIIKTYKLLQGIRQTLLKWSEWTSTYYICKDQSDLLQCLLLSEKILVAMRWAGRLALAHPGNYQGYIMEPPVESSQLPIPSLQTTSTLVGPRFDFSEIKTVKSDICFMFYVLFSIFTPALLQHIFCEKTI